MHNFNKLRRKRKGAKKLKIIDLSRTITPGMQGFPGDAAPAIERREEGGFRTADLSFCSHTGTHIDAPAHLSSQSVTLDMMSPETFWGLALLADARAAAGRGIEIADLAPHAEKLAEADFLLLRTGWEDKFGTEEYLAGFPALSCEAAQYALSLGIRGFGFDTISADSVESEECPIHRQRRKRGMPDTQNAARRGRAHNRKPARPRRAARGRDLPARRSAHAARQRRRRARARHGRP